MADKKKDSLSIIEANRIRGLIIALEPLFRRAFLNMVTNVQAGLTLDALGTLLARGQLEQALLAVFRASEGLGAAWINAFIDSGQSTASMITRAFSKIPPAELAFGEVSVSFDLTNERAVRTMRENRVRLIREFSTAQREATREALISGIQRGANPIEQARAFRASIGLTQKQVQAVENFRGLLEAQDSRSLTRALRDRRFDPTVSRSIREGLPLKQSQINRMVDRYRERFLIHRSQTIARTEALRSVHEGNQQMFRQAIEDRVLQEDQLVRIWNTSLLANVRDTHQSMHGQERGIEEPFISGGGAALMFPGDPQAPASETVQCVCNVSTRILSLEETGAAAFVV